jgi:hypothetical protein
VRCHGLVCGRLHSGPIFNRTLPEAGDVDQARLLLDHGADPNLVDTHIHATPWGWANHFGHHDTAAYLCELFGLSVEGATPYAAALDHTDTILPAASQGGRDLG